MHYEVEVHGLRRRVELPFVTAVIADLSGKPTEPLPPMADRLFVEIDRDSFEACMKETRPRVAFLVPNALTGDGTLRVDLVFQSMEDFEPERLARQVDALRLLLDARDASAEDVARELDQRVDQQLDLIVHFPDLQRLEATWRGLYHLVEQSETDDSLKIKVLNSAKAELARTLKRYKGTAWDQSPLFKRLYTDGYGSAGGDPVGCVLLDYEFDHSPPDVELLGELARIGEAIHAPMIASASPALLQMDSWQELSLPRSLAKIFTTPEYSAWRLLRETDEARYLVLTLPRFLARGAHVRETNSEPSYAYREDLNDGNHRSFIWASSGYLLVINIHRSFKIYGWCTQIEGLTAGGAVEDLPRIDLRTDGGATRTIWPTETAIDDRRGAELAAVGLVPLVWRMHLNMAVFPRVRSLQRPAEFDDPAATERARDAIELPYILAVSRVAHYIKAIVRDLAFAKGDRAAVQAWLDRWIAAFAEPDAGSPGGYTQRIQPLESASVVVEESAGEGGPSYTTKFYVRPNRGWPGRT